MLKGESEIFIDWCEEERDIFSIDMLRDSWWLEIPASKRVIIENILIPYDQMLERLRLEQSTPIKDEDKCTCTLRDISDNCPVHSEKKSLWKQADK